jgi:hypothetical protein
MLGQADLRVQIGRQTFVLNVWVSDKVPQFLLGYDWLSRNEVYYRFGDKSLLARGETILVYVRFVCG